MATQLSLGQLTTPVNETDALASVLATLQAFGFQATSWQSGSVQRNFAQTLAKLYSSITYTVADIAASGFATLAKGTYQKYLAIYSYGLTPIAATQTIGSLVLTSSAGAPVNNWVDGGILVADKPPGSNGANVYRVVGAGSLPGNSTQTITFKADVPGAVANIAPNVPLYLWTSLTGVTVANPVVAGTLTWITTPGTDDESESRLSARMIGRWYTIAYAVTDGAYRYWALSGLPALTRVTVKNDPVVAGGVNVVGATATGGLSVAQINTLSDYINGVTDGVGRRAINDIVSVLSANTLSSPGLSCTVTVRSQYASDVVSRITSALIVLFGSIPIGGKVLPGGSLGYVLLADLYTTIMAQAGVVNVVFASPTSDVIMGPLDIYSPPVTINTVIV